MTAMSQKPNTRKPKLLLVCHLPPPVHGASMVGEAIRNSELINSEFECRFINLSTAVNLNDIGRFSLGKLMRVRKLRKDIIRGIKDFQPDLVYFTPCAAGVPFIKDWYAIRPAKKLAPKIAFHYHNKGVARYASKKPYDRLYRSFFSDVNVILLSKMLRKDVEKYVGDKQLSYCANGIKEWEGFTPVEKPADLPPKILFVSNLFKTKGVYTLLTAFEMLHSKGISFRGDIVGADTQEITSVSLRDEIRRRGLEGSVRCRGALYGDDKVAAFAEADIFAFPTLYPNECFPLVILEAMQCGLPVVASSEGAIPELIDDEVNGYVLGNATAAELAVKLERLITDPAERADMGARAKEKFMQLYTLPAFEKRFVSVIKGILSRPAPEERHK